MFVILIVADCSLRATVSVSVADITIAVVVFWWFLFSSACGSTSEKIAIFERLPVAFSAAARHAIPVAATTACCQTSAGHVWRPQGRGKFRFRFLSSPVMPFWRS